MRQSQLQFQILMLFGMLDICAFNFREAFLIDYIQMGL